MPKRQPQTQRAWKPAPLTPAQIAQLADYVRSGGPTGLPPPRPGHIWALVDSGAEPDVAPHRAIFGTTALNTSRATEPFTAANGSPIANRGTYLVQYEASSGHKRSIEFQDADVAIPSISARRLPDNDNFRLYHKRGVQSLTRPRATRAPSSGLSVFVGYNVVLIHMS